MGVPCDEILGNHSKGLPGCFYTLWNACERAPGDVWLVYPGQRIGIRPHREREGWDATRHALGALDFHDTLGGQRAPTPLEHQRGKLDSCCEGDLYSHLLAKD